MPNVLNYTNAFPGIAFPQHLAGQTTTVLDYIFPGAVQPKSSVPAVLSYTKAYPGASFVQHLSGQTTTVQDYIYSGAVQPLPGGPVFAAGLASGTGTANAIGQALWANMAEADGIGTAPGIGAFTGGAKQVVGWFDQWDRRRRIPVEQLNAILAAQGREPFPVTELEAKIEKAKSPRLRKVVEEALEEVAVRAEEPYDWAPVVALFQAAARTTRTTAAIKNAEQIIPLLRERIALEARERDDEEAIVMLFEGFY